MPVLALRRFARTPMQIAVRATLAAALIAVALAALAAAAQAAPLTFTVNSTADPGTGICDVTECTLREALLAANANTGADTIAFNLDQTSFPPHVIAPTSALPAVTEAVTIDGSTQPDYFHDPAVQIDGTNAGVSTSGLSLGASSTVKALAIDAFSGAGIALTGGSSTIRGTWIGLTTANGGAGIAIGVGAPNNTIGGTGPDDPDSISQSGGAGIAISSSGNTIQATEIGTGGANGGAGVSITTGSNNVVGGTTAGDGNTIQNNTGAGVAITAGTGNAVEGNSIDANGGLGIDLGTTGLTPNDHLDPDTGPNNLQNFPVLTTASNDSLAGTSTVTGTLDSAAATAYHVEIFASSACDPSGHGEAPELVSSAEVTTSGSGAGTIDSTFPTGSGNIYTATATDPSGNTSELSTCVAAPPRLTVDKAGNGTGTVTSTPAGINCGATCSADYALNTPVTLHATPDSGMAFGGWSGGGCSGTADCVVTMDASQSVTATFTDPTFPLHLAQAIAHDPAVVTGASLTAPPNGTPDAIRTTALAGYPTNGATYGILTSGDATLADHAGAGASASDGGINVRGNSDYDVSILKVDLNVPSGANCLSIDFRFLSTEYPTYVGSSFNDAFVAELDTSDWTTAGSVITAPHNFAFDPSHDVISINSTGATAMTAANAAGTGYGGGTDPLHASTVITSGPHSLYLSIFDQGDSVLDSAALLDNLNLSTRDAAACASGASSDNTPPTVTLTTPANASSTSDTTPTYSGAAGTATGDLGTITVNVYAGSAVTGSPTQTLSTTQSGGAWTVDGTTPLAPGTYTAQAQQSDSSGNIGFSSANTFTISGTARTLTVTKAGAGSGTVTSSPGAISCGATCSDSYGDGTSVTLTATPASGSRFSGWSGDCSGTGTCTLTMSANKAATATFVIQRTLTVTKAGTGSGTVTSSPGTINCGATCSNGYDDGTSVTLTATPATGSTFTGWSGDCTGTGTCTLTMSANKAVTATFAKRMLTVTKAGSGSGTVTSSPGAISCGATCSDSYNDGTSVTLTATPASGSRFTGWSGDCSGTGTCTLTMSADKAVTATFVIQRSLTVTKAGSGSGTVTSSPGAISCGATCSANYDDGTSVTLTAAPATGSTFTGWSGDCTGTGTCTLTMSANKAVTATFAKRSLTVAKAGSGSGTVTSSVGAISCGATCSDFYDNGTSVTLTATPATGSTFTGWTGDCAGTGTCTLTMSADHSATATFTADVVAPPKHTLTVTKAGTGSGSITSAPGAISCGATCSASYDDGTSVTLTATPATGSSFTGWSGDCSGTGTCTLTMSADHSATATFTAAIPPPVVGGPPGVKFDDLFCGAQHRGGCAGLKVKGTFDRPGNASWTFDAYNPSPGGKPAAAVAKKIRLGQIKRVITKAGAVTVIFKLKKGAKTTKLFTQVKKAKLKSVLVTLTLTSSTGEKKTSTRTVKLKG